MCVCVGKGGGGILQLQINKVKKVCHLYDLYLFFYFRCLSNALCLSFHENFLNFIFLQDCIVLLLKKIYNKE